jgi:hypothetical protein
MLLNSILIVATGYESASLFDQLMPLLILSGIFGLICWTVYNQSKHSYPTTRRVHEPITYTEKGIHAKGSSFESDLNWDTLHKVQETKSWFAFFQSNQAAGLVAKTAFQSKEQVHALRVMIASQHNLKHKLRKDYSIKFIVGTSLNLVV